MTSLVFHALPAPVVTPTNEPCEVLVQGAFVHAMKALIVGICPIFDETFNFGSSPHRSAFDLRSFQLTSSAMRSMRV